MILLGPMRRQRPLRGRPNPAACDGIDDDIDDIGDIDTRPFNSPGA
jgi:hypothetical protein